MASCGFRRHRWAACLVILTALGLTARAVGEEDEASRIMSEFSGFAGAAEMEGFQGSSRELKTSELLDGIGAVGKTGISGVGGKFKGKKESKKQKVIGVVDEKKEFIKNVAESKEQLVLGAQKNFGDQYEKNKGLLSRVLNLLGIPAGADPLRDARDEVGSNVGTVSTAGADLQQVLSSNLDNTIQRTMDSKDALVEGRAENEAGLWKALIRNFLRLEEGLSDFKEAIEEISDELCSPAEFVPPERKSPEFMGPGMSLTIAAGVCDLKVNKEFKDYRITLECTKPSITYSKTPPMYISEHKTASEFRTRECKEERVLGQDLEGVLHVFDGSGDFDTSLLQAVLAENRLPSSIAGGLNLKPDATNDIISGLLGKKKKNVFDKSFKKKFSLLDLKGKDKFSLLGPKAGKAKGLLGK